MFDLSARCGTTQDPQHEASNHLATETHAGLTAQLEDRLAAARPRLLRLAQTNGVPEDSAEDVVQEAWVAAWSHLDHLRSPERFDAWLDGICRNTARLFLRRRAKQELPLSRLLLLDSEEHDPSVAVPPSHRVAPGPDPLEELDHHARVLLLEQALAAIPEMARHLLEAHYLAEIPQRELAAQLGLTLSALEARLHRARRRLRLILSTELRTQAEDTGFIPSSLGTQGWRETRLWCDLCGRRRLVGTFESCEAGHVNLCLRCPDCASRLGLDHTRSNGIVLLSGLRSLRPALKRTMQVMTTEFLQALLSGQRICACCGKRALVRLVTPEEAFLPLPNKFWIEQDCPVCGRSLWTLDEIVCWPNREVQAFKADHRRHITEPDLATSYADQPAIRFRLSDLNSPARLNVFAHRQTLQILATVRE